MRFTPVSIISAAGLFGFAVVIAATLLAIRQPWLGITFGADSAGHVVVLRTQGPGGAVPPGTLVSTIRSNADEVRLRALDLVAEPDGAMGDYQTYRDFLQRQGRLAAIMAAGEVTVVAAGGDAFPVMPEPSRPVSSLPVGFWVQVTVGLFAMLISSAVFAFRSHVSSARYLLLSGVATLTFASFAAVYSTRELALPSTLFRWLNDGNFLGGSLFTASFVALLLTYPRRLGPAWLGPCAVGLFLVWFILQQTSVFHSMTFARRALVLTGVFTTFALAGIHWFGTRKKPVARAALQWFLLSWMLGTSLFAVFILLPQMFGVDTSGLQGYAFLLFLLVYGGLAFGILRFRLFDLGEWWARIVIWSLTVLMLVLFDLLFLLVLQLSTELSLGLALLITGLLWVPLRSFVWGRFLGTPHKSGDVLFRQIIDVALAPPTDDRQARWIKVLGDVFEPLHSMPVERADTVSIGRDGLELTIPAIGTYPAMRLEYAQGGRRLFSTGDVALADELCAMLRHTIAGRSAFEKGVAEERARIALDMHDNIGAQLLSALHSSDAKRKDVMIRDTLSDLRDIINDSAHTELTFAETLADLRAETAERLSQSGIALDWSVNAKDMPAVTPSSVHALRSIVREAVSNVIKHAQAKTVRIGLERQAGTITLTVEDDGKGTGAGNAAAGSGLSNMRSRIAKFEGSLDFGPGECGFRLTATLPLKGMEGRE